MNLRVLFLALTLLFGSCNPFDENQVPVVTVGPGVRPLIAGATYTATVFRKEERGSGEGFTNTRHRYVGTLTFVTGE